MLPKQETIPSYLATELNHERDESANESTFKTSITSIHSNENNFSKDLFSLDDSNISQKTSNFSSDDLSSLQKISNLGDFSSSKNIELGAQYYKNKNKKKILTK